MAKARYDILEMFDGEWAVIDVKTRKAAEVNGVKQVGLEWGQADDLADLLNYIQAQKDSGTVQ